jgi:hypothetical protein
MVRYGDGREGMTASLAEIGAALYGPRWVRPLADALGNDRRLVQRWNAGSEPIPEGVWRDLYEMLRQRSIEHARLSYHLMQRFHPNEGE